MTRIRRSAMLAQRKATTAATRACVVLALCGCSLSLSSVPGTWEEVKADVRSRYPGVPQLTTRDLHQGLLRKDPILLIDVRTPEEFAISRIPGAKNLPGGTGIHQAFGAEKREGLVVLYCSVGYRSSQVAQNLRQAGFREVHNLEGSIFQWANEGRPLEGPHGPASQVHPYDEEWGSLLREHLRAPLPREN